MKGSAGGSGSRVRGVVGPCGKAEQQVGPSFPVVLTGCRLEPLRKRCPCGPQLLGRVCRGMMEPGDAWKEGGKRR